MNAKPPGLQEHVPLAPYTTLKIGGPADYLLTAKTADEVETSLDWAKQEGLAVGVLGVGGNTLVSDQGWRGLVLIMQNDEFDWQPPEVTVGAGAKVGQLIGGALQHGLGGLRWLIGVPGTIGGSLVGNAGGHGWGLGDQVRWVEVTAAGGQRQRLSKEECAFGYRTSIFKRHSGWVVLQARLTLPPVDPTAERRILAETTARKNASQPTAVQSAGCMFMNPAVDRRALPEHLARQVDAGERISAWRLIVVAGLQGKRIGRIQVSPQHANFMVNLGGATADEVVQLLSLVKQQVRDKLGVQLHEEVRYLGF